MSVSVSIQSSVIALAPGDSATLVAVATRLDGRRGELQFTMSLPPDFDATVTSQVESGAVTTAEIRIRAPASITASRHIATLHVTGASAGRATVWFELEVAPHPGIDVTPERPEVTLIPGGVLPLNVAIARTVITDPVTLTLVAPAGISLVAPNDPVVGSRTRVTLAVTSGVAPGTYPAILRGSAPGVPDDDAPLLIVVSPDPLQLILDDVASVQATLVSAEIIVNRNGVAGTIAFTAEGLPPSVTFSAAPTAGTLASAEFAISAGALPGNYPLTLRGSDGSQSVATTFHLTIAPSNVGLTLVPQNVAVLSGTAATSLLTLARTSFDGTVAVAVDDVPAGVSVEISDSTVSGTTTTVLIAVSEAVSAGVYTLTVRAFPSPTTGEPGSPVLDPVSAPLTLTVVEAPVGGNVLLDWSRCSEPAWVAGQDGSGPWVRLAGALGRFAMAVTSARGGIAFTSGQSSLVVRYATHAELTAAPLDMCPPEQSVGSTRSVSGTTDFGNIVTSAEYTWHLGGGTGTSSLASPDFTIVGVGPGVHDLIGTGTIGLGRGPIQILRGVGPLAGEFIGTIGVFWETAVTPVNAVVRVGSLAGEGVSIRQNYLTTGSCSVTEFNRTGSSSASGAPSFSVLAIPAAKQSSTDFHQFDVTASSPSGHRRASLSVHALTSDVVPTVALPPALPPYLVTALSGSHQRLRLVMDAIPTGYDGDLTLSFADGLASVTIVHSAALLAEETPGPLTLEMPELGGTSGFPVGTVPTATAHGNWTIGITGSNGHATDCIEGASRWSIARTGTF